MSQIINECISRIVKVDLQSSKLMQMKLDKLAKPVGGLGRLEELGCHLAAIQKTTELKLDNKTLLVFAADHGVSIEGVSATPKCVTYLQACNTIEGKTAVAALAKVSKTKIEVIDIGIDCDKHYSGIINKKIALGTKNLAIEKAMSYEDAIKSIEIGIEVAQEAIDSKTDVLAVGELGIGNTTPSAAIVSLYTKDKVEDIVGKGSNISETRLINKIKVVKDAIKLHEPNIEDPIDVLSKVGGFEIGGKVGAILAASANNTPIVIDGFISYSAAFIAIALCPESANYIIASHQSAELGSQIALNKLNFKTYLSLDLCVGEGTGAVMMMNLINGLDSVLKNMATLNDLDIEFDH